MVDHKTGAMFKMLLRLMQAASPLISTYDIEPLSRLVGRCYQIRDDYMNLQGVEYSKQKGFCDDLDEGKFSYPVVHCVQTDRSSQDLILGIFRQRQVKAAGAPLAVESKLQIIGCMEKAGTFEATRRLLRQLEEEMEKEIEMLESQTAEPNPVMRLLLENLRVPQPKGVGMV
jgi:geranylgeranyl pyrophosphate synthase